jgi:hypothetical protein
MKRAAVKLANMMVAVVDRERGCGDWGSRGQMGMGGRSRVE